MLSPGCVSELPEELQVLPYRAWASCLPHPLKVLIYWAWEGAANDPQVILMRRQKQEPRLCSLQLPGNSPRIPETLLHRVAGVFPSLARLCISSDHSRVVKEHFPFLLCVDT